jgi:hypothetical protein
MLLSLAHHPFITLNVTSSIRFEVCNQFWTANQTSKALPRSTSHWCVRANEVTLFHFVFFAAPFVRSALSPSGWRNGSALAPGAWPGGLPHFPSQELGFVFFPFLVACVLISPTYARTDLFDKLVPKMRSVLKALGAAAAVAKYLFVVY